MFSCSLLNFLKNGYSELFVIHFIYLLFFGVSYWNFVSFGGAMFTCFFMIHIALCCCLFEGANTSSCLYMLISAGKDPLPCPQTDETASRIVIEWDWSQVTWTLQGLQLDPLVTGGCRQAGRVTAGSPGTWDWLRGHDQVRLEPSYKDASWSALECTDGRPIIRVDRCGSCWVPEWAYTWMGASGTVEEQRWTWVTKLLHGMQSGPRSAVLLPEVLMGIGCSHGP